VGPELALCVHSALDEASLPVAGIHEANMEGFPRLKKKRPNQTFTGPIGFKQG
jgi:hypothetical protein